MNESTFAITSRIDHDGFKLWGFRLSSGFRQLPNWHTKRDAVASAKFHIEQGA